MTTALLAGGLVLATALAFLVAACIRNADLVDGNLADCDPDPECHYCARPPLVPHPNPNECRCPQCLAVIDIVRAMVIDDVWDVALQNELGA